MNTRQNEEFRMPNAGSGSRITRRGKAATEPREAYGVRPACWRCRREPVDQKAGASSAHSIRFASYGARNILRSLRADSAILVHNSAVRSAKADHASRITRHVSLPLPTSHAISRTRQAFTMIEIAISLAVIGFALVAIIGILPMAMNVQKDNRQETIINQDNSILMNAIRNGERGLDDLTNYVMAITNYWRAYTPRGAPSGPVHTNVYTYTSSSDDRGSAVPQFPIISGQRIIGLLTTPKITFYPGGAGAFRSNHVVAFMRSMSGAASEKSPQTNSTVQDFALTYKLISEVIPYGTNFFNPLWTYIGDPALVPGSAEAVGRTNYLRLVNELQRNLYELRLTFRWPVLPNGGSGAGRQVFRTTVAGSIDGLFVPPGLTNLYYPDLTNLYFFQPGNFVQSQ